MSLEAIVTEREEVFCAEISDLIQWKHTVELFISINKYLLDRE